MAPTPYLNDRSRQVATIAAAIALPGKVDGELITTAAREEAGDGGGATYIYRAAGREAITEDGWRYFDGAVSTGDGGSDYLELVSVNEVLDLREWGSIPSSGDISTLFQNVITNCAEHSAIKVPGGPNSGYEIADLVIPNSKVMHIVGTGVKVAAAAGATYMLDFGQDTRRNAPLIISGLEFHGNSLDVVGLKTSGRTNVILQGLSIKYCMTAGIDLILAYNTGLNDCVIERNYVGLKVRQTALGGGGNANTYRNVEVYLNTIGIILDGTDSSFPQENNKFVGGTIQSNTLCGIATFGTGNLTLDGVHFESNGSSGTTATVDDNTIRKSSCHFHSSGVRMNSCSPGSDNPFVTLEASSTLHMDGMHTYGVTGQLVKDYDATNTVVMSGRIAGRGSIDAKVDSLPSQIDWQSNFSFVSDPVIVPSTIPDNLATTTNTPVPSNTDGATLNANVVDDVHGPTTSVTFAASTGSSSSNRCILTANLGTVSTGNHILVTLLVKTDTDTRLRFDVTDGSYTSLDYTFRDRNWQKVTLMATAGSTNTPGLYIYPSDDAGATVQFAKLQSLKSTGTANELRMILRENLYNAKSSPIVNQTLTADTSLTLSLGYESAFEMHLKQDATGQHSVVWPNDAVFYGFPPQPTGTPNSTSIVPFRIVGEEFICTRVDASSTNYCAVFDGVDDTGNIPSITFPDAGTVMMKLKLASATHATRTQGLQYAASGAGDTHYPYNDGKGYIDWLRTTRASTLTLEASLDRTGYHWVIARTDADDDWEFLQATTAGTLYSIATATHEALGEITLGKLHNNTQFIIDRFMLFGSRLDDTDAQAVIASAATDTLPEAPLARYEIDLDPGTTKLADSSGNGKHIPLTGIAQTFFQET